MWSIAEVKNEVKITKKIALELLKCGADVCCAWKYDEEAPDENYIDSVMSGDKLYFDPDHFEHMDYLWEKEIQKVLKKYKVKGDVCFYSSEGDNAGRGWGYRFDGKGGMKKLNGVLVWEEVK